MLTLSLSIAALAGAKPTRPLQALPDSVQPAVLNSTLAGALPNSQVLHLAIGLKLSDPEGLQAFVDTVCNPRSPSYQHFATPEQLGAKFGASLTDVNSVVTYLKANGFNVTLVGKSRSSILADATVSQAQAAFGTRINTYKGFDPLGKPITYVANATSVLVPTNIANAIQCVAGLDDYSRPRRFTTLSPSMLRTLYGTQPSYTGGFTGAGCNIAYSNWDGYKISNAQDFISHFSLPVPSGGSGSNIHVVSVSGSNNNTEGGGEGDLDMQMELSAVPLANLYVYDSTSSNLLATLTKEQDDNIADVISESYGWSGYSGTNGTSVHNEHVLMSGQGITYLCATGDNGTGQMSSYNYPDVDPEITTVGGTMATTDSNGNRTSEVSWSGSQGGWSTATFGSPNFNVHPSWQTGTGVLSEPYRMVPDIAGQSQSGDDAAVYIYFQGGLSTIAGTSVASPWTASALASLESRLAANGQPRRFGRLNDLIYSENGRSDVWFDITSGSGNGNLPNGVASVPTVGWDTVTGWGAPHFDGWYTALAIQTVAPSSYTLVDGVLNSGTLASLAAIDAKLSRHNASDTEQPHGAADSDYRERHVQPCYGK